MKSLLVFSIFFLGSAFAETLEFGMSHSEASCHGTTCSGQSSARFEIEIEVENGAGEYRLPQETHGDFQLDRYFRITRSDSECTMTLGAVWTSGNEPSSEETAMSCTDFYRLGLLTVANRVNIPNGHFMASLEVYTEEIDR